MPYLKAYWYYNKEFFVEQQGVELLPDFTKKILSGPCLTASQVL